MAIELVTAYKGKDHVTAEQWADFNRGIYGDAAILPVGNKMETAIQTANQITVKDGVAVIDGRQVYIGYGESENIAIQSGTQGKLRRDIVVLEYKKEEVSGVETVQFKVITGTPADSDAKDPSVQDMDIRTGVFTSQKPFCRVRLNGTAIEGVDTLIPVKEFKSHAFAAPVNNLTGTNPDLALAATQGREIKKQIDALNSSLENLKYWEYKLSSGDYYYEKDICFYKLCGSVTVYNFGIKMNVSIDLNRFTTIGYIPQYYTPAADITFPVMNASNGEYVGMMQLGTNGDIRLCPLIDVMGMDLLFSATYINYN